MNLQNIRIIGFDLDQTLYPKSPEIDEAIQAYIYKKIADYKNCSLEEAKALFKSYYPKISGRKTLIALNIPNAVEIIDEAIAGADIENFLVPNPEVLELLKSIKTKYQNLSLITGSKSDLAYQKLKKLNIPAELFDCIITGEQSKSDGTAFRKWMNNFMSKDSSLKPEQFLYIGDNGRMDAEMPISLGMKAVLVNVRNKRPELSAPQFNYLIEVGSVLL